MVSRPAVFAADSPGYREVGGLGLWNSAGWADGASGEQESQVGDVAPLIGGPGRDALTGGPGFDIVIQ